MSKSRRAKSPGATQTNVRTNDSFANFQARLGWGADNQSSASQYTLSYQSRNRIWLEAAYRGSWVVGKAVDAPAEDMTRAGIEMSGLEPDEMGALDRDFHRMQLWDRMCDTIKWARLYGGCIAVMLIEGQDESTPLRLDSITKGQFKGLLVLDRWMVSPPTGQVITELGPDMGLPEFYNVMAGVPFMNGKKIHYTRVLRLEGADLPYYQRISENGWGLSILEPMWDRLIAFDSTTVGAGQLVYKAHLRTYQVEGLREIIAMGGTALAGLKAQMDFTRMSQTNEGMTIMDAKDTFEAHAYSFAGLSDMLIQFGQQLSGATGIPLVRLFGQSPAGMNATGDGDMKQYHEGIGQQQERRLRNPIYRLLSVMSRSTLQKPLPDGFGFEFKSLQQMSETEKADNAVKTADAVTKAVGADLMSRSTAMKELKSSSPVTGMFGHITDEDIAAAEEEEASAPPPVPEGDVDEGLIGSAPTKDSFFGRLFKR